MNGLVVVTCGGAKRSSAAPARDLYTGAYFRSCAAAAHALTPSQGWLILSAKHGLVTPDTVLEPYNLRLGQPGCVMPARVRLQATNLGVIGVTMVVALAGKAYVDVARQVWPNLIAPLHKYGGMGHQMAYLATVARTGKL